ncbi:MAG: hypothetical protein GY731_03175, partial [Gammaproteobacteria bacterium]|nr:hypothetical protein [Gammaproteobacteria bacterium]
MNSKYAEFHPGQRWLSEAESDLGLGTVTREDDRCVHITFPATGETRIYARKEAPLIRVTFSTGDLIKNLDGLELSVIEAHADEGVLTYLCQALDGT